MFSWESPDNYEGKPVGFGVKSEGGFSNPAVPDLSSKAQVEVWLVDKGHVDSRVRNYRKSFPVEFRAGKPAEVVFGP